MKRFYFFLILLIFLGVSCKEGINTNPDTGYILESEVVFSRHNIRSPLSGPGSELSLVTPYEWVDRGVGTAYLTDRGGRIEHFLIG